MGSWEHVIETTKKLEELKPGSSEHIPIQARAFESLKMHKQALESYNKLIELEPNNMDHWTAITWIIGLRNLNCTRN
jgi:tetratricopeptide (TPR) repeat protein